VDRVVIFGESESPPRVVEKDLSDAGGLVEGGEVSGLRK